MLFDQGVLAFLISKMDGIGGLHGWAWIFLLEGLATVVFAVASFFLIVDYPETATFLTVEEKQYLLERLRVDRSSSSMLFDMRFVWAAFKDWKVYLQTGIYIGFILPIYALSLFLPTIITELGFTAAHAQLLTVPPYIAALPIVVSCAILSDKYKIRGPFILVGAVFGITGFAVIMNTTKPWVGYGGAVLGAIGGVVPISSSLAWIGNNVAGDVKRAVFIAIVLSLSNYFGIIGSFIYTQSDAPRYHTGHSIVIGCFCLTFGLTIVAMFTYHRLNKKKEELCRREGINDSQRDEFADLGDESPLFRYTL